MSLNLPAWVTATPLVDSNNRSEWLAARATGITASDVAKLMTPQGRTQVIREKLWADEQDDNPFMKHGRDRERPIAEWMNENWWIQHNTWLFAAADNPTHLATPDGVGTDGPSEWCLGEIKTSAKPLPKTTPRNYRDQIQWQLHVLGAKRCLLVWEQHVNGVPADLEAVTRWVDRDEERISELVTVADELLAYINSERAVA